MNQEFKNLKIGDEVIICSRGIYSFDTIGTVSNITATQIAVTYKGATKKYRITTGSEVGEGSGSIGILTDDDRKRIEMETIRRRFKTMLNTIDLNMDKVDNDDILKIYAQVKGVVEKIMQKGPIKR